MAIVTPQDRERFFEIIDKWDVETRVIGHLTGDDAGLFHGHHIVDVDPKTAAHEGPRRLRPPLRAPRVSGRLQAANSKTLPVPPRARNNADVAVLSDVNQASKAWVTDQYDRRYV